MIAAVSFKNQVISRGILHWTYEVQMAVSIKNLLKTELLLGNTFNEEINLITVNV